jgi:hypothetical protein
MRKAVVVLLMVLVSSSVLAGEIPLATGTFETRNLEVAGKYGRGTFDLMRLEIFEVNGDKAKARFIMKGFQNSDVTFTSDITYDPGTNMPRIKVVTGSIMNEFTQVDEAGTAFRLPTPARSVTAILKKVEGE